MSDKFFVRSVKDGPLSVTKFINHVNRRIVGFKKHGKNTIPIDMNSEVIILPGGGDLLPYFCDNRGRWKIVLVSQFRLTVKKKTLEAPGGRLDGEPPKIALSRELKEETGIKVNPRSIKIVFHEYTHPSIISSCVFGAIVKIRNKIVRNKRKAGNKSENEQTQVEIFDLIKILKKREAGLIKIDLVTSRLIDEVAKTVGLIVKKY